MRRNTMSPHSIGETLYFANPGEVNTNAIIEASRKRAIELKIDTILVASDTGRSALKAANALKGTAIKLIAVTTPPCTTWGPESDIPSGIVDEKTRIELGRFGVRIVQATPPFYNRKLLERFLGFLVLELK
jgi:hypothetical protein